MHLRPISLWPVLLCAGCLTRQISDAIDGLHCGSTSGDPTDSGETTMDCPEESSSSGTAGETLGSSSTSASATDSSGSDSGSDSETGTSTGTGSTTGEPAAVCGNGVVEGTGPEPEECDDGNEVDDDGCRACARDRRVFVTSMVYQGGIFDEGGVDSGLMGADVQCRSLAAQAMLPNFAGYKAWLSDSQESARERLFAGRGRYVLVNGLVVADSWEALLAGALQNPIDVTELSETKDTGVYTGTNPDGSAAVGADFCADWSENSQINKAHWGVSSEITASWTLADAPFDQPSSCATDRSLYCFEQE